MSLLPCPPPPLFSPSLPLSLPLSPPHLSPVHAPCGANQCEGSVTTEVQCTYCTDAWSLCKCCRIACLPCKQSCLEALERTPLRLLLRCPSPERLQPTQQCITHPSTFACLTNPATRPLSPSTLSFLPLPAFLPPLPPPGGVDQRPRAAQQQRQWRHTARPAREQQLPAALQPRGVHRVN